MRNRSQTQTKGSPVDWQTLIDTYERELDDWLRVGWEPNEFAAVLIKRIKIEDHISPEMLAHIHGTNRERLRERARGR